MNTGQSAMILSRLGVTTGWLIPHVDKPVDSTCKSSAVAEMGDRLTTIDTSPTPFFWGELGPHLTQCRLGWGLSPYQVASWSIQPFGHKRYMGRKLRGSAPLGRGAGSPSNTMWPGPRPTCVPSFILILDPSNRLATVHQWYRQTDIRTDNSLITKGEPFYTRSPKNDKMYRYMLTLVTCPHQPWAESTDYKI